ncbi:hypothetical protein AGMMS50268_34590 [Spirochaetia bacterium]|nr:hypothetical protein AGMMS50268_34590 [Spirochaetia bacterium]
MGKWYNVLGSGGNNNGITDFVHSGCGRYGYFWGLLSEAVPQEGADEYLCAVKRTV